MDRELTEQYAAGGEKLSLAIRGLTSEDMRWVPPPDAPPELGRWSIQQVVVHTMDSDLVSSDRLKRMIAEEKPMLIGYDETRFARHLFYEEQPAEEAAAIVDFNRRLFARVLRKLPDAAWNRAGQHNERGRITVGGYLKAVVDHLEHHMKFIHEKRAAMGKEMW